MGLNYDKAKEALREPTREEVTKHAWETLDRSLNGENISSDAVETAKFLIQQNMYADQYAACNDPIPMDSPGKKKKKGKKKRKKNA